ncbi:MAG: hypothetical protein U9Q79_10960, partial [Candidatus Hydrogenedentes bacterium]|nr:hypothetical protein [Candidatus Hydrogenedentota bacterium]
MGAFVHNLLANLGVVPTFELGMRLVVGAAAVYVTAQLLFVVLVKALKPTRSRKFLLAESVSHVAAFVLLPFLMRMHIAWPDPTLAKAEPLLYLAAYLALLGVLKLFSFYTALYCEPSGRLHILGWLGAACVAAGLAGVGLLQWYVGIEEARPQTTSMPSMYRIGDTYAEARPVYEGALANYDLPVYNNRGITFRWANSPHAGHEEALERAYVTVLLQGAETESYQATVSLEDDMWAGLYVPAEDIPADATRCTVSWTQQRPPSWMGLLGFMPVVHSDRQLLLSGPLLHEQRTDETPPNFVIIGMDGLTPAHMSLW